MPIKDVRLILKTIEEWESRRAVMENEFGERLSDRLAAAILTAMLPEEFKDMVYQAQGSGETVYTEVRDKVLSVAGSRIQSAQPTPMDVGAITDGKSEQADVWGDEADRINAEINQVKGNGKGSQCYRCGGYGHMARACGTPAPSKGDSKGGGKSAYGDYSKGGKGQGKETRECFNCKKTGHLSKDCWAKGGGKAKGKGVNEVAVDAVEVGSVWMIAGMEEPASYEFNRRVQQAYEEKQTAITETSNYWKDLLSESEEESSDDEEDELKLDESDDDEKDDLKFSSGPPGISQFDLLFKQQTVLSSITQQSGLSSSCLSVDLEADKQGDLFKGLSLVEVPEADLPCTNELTENDECDFVELTGEECLFKGLEITKDSLQTILIQEDLKEPLLKEKPMPNEELSGTGKGYSAPKEITMIEEVFEINGVENDGLQVKIAIDSAAAESVCPMDWAGQFKVKPCVPGQERSFINASGGEIKHYGEKRVALLTKGSSGSERKIGLPFQACDVKRPLAAVRRICEKGNIVQFGPGEKDNFIMNVQSQEKIWLKQEKGQYIMEASLMTDSPF